MKKTKWSKEEDQAIELMLETNAGATPYQIGQWLAGDPIERSAEAIARRVEYLKINRQKEIIAKLSDKEEVEPVREDCVIAKPTYMQIAGAVKRIQDEYGFCVKDALLILRASRGITKNE